MENAMIVDGIKEIQMGSNRNEAGKRKGVKEEEPISMHVISTRDTPYSFHGVYPRVVSVRTSASSGGGFSRDSTSSLCFRRFASRNWNAGINVSQLEIPPSSL
ncbi:hypothetical protein V1478_005464 [Vespula squamosa]|uniref:Uncharacterized protein n=1 Tax=Vespula squamosa TaxID=30214 RepID=A0ABD2BE86_VESSQ